MNGKELRRLVENHDRDGVFDYASAARDLVWDDSFSDDAFRTLTILADTVRILDIFDLVDDLNKSSATWAWRFEAHKAAYEDVEEMLFLRPVHVFQLVKQLYTVWSKGIENDLVR